MPSPTSGESWSVTLIHRQRHRRNRLVPMDDLISILLHPLKVSNRLILQSAPLAPQGRSVTCSTPPIGLQEFGFQAMIDLGCFPTPEHSNGERWKAKRLAIHLRSQCHPFFTHFSTLFETTETNPPVAPIPGFSAFRGFRGNRASDPSTRSWKANLRPSSEPK